MTLRRLGRPAEAEQVLEPISTDMEIIENAAYHKLLLMYRGEIAPEELAQRGSGHRRWRDDPLRHRQLVALQRPARAGAAGLRARDRADRSGARSGSSLPNPISLAYNDARLLFSANSDNHARALAPGAYAFSPSAIPVALTAVLILAFGAARADRAAFTERQRRVLHDDRRRGDLDGGVHASCTARATPAAALRWARRAYLGVPFIAPAIYWFTVEILRIERRRRLAHVARLERRGVLQRHRRAHRPAHPARAAVLVGLLSALLADRRRRLPARSSSAISSPSLVEFLRAYPHARGDASSCASAR